MYISSPHPRPEVMPSSHFQDKYQYKCHRILLSQNDYYVYHNLKQKSSGVETVLYSLDIYL